MLSFKQLDIKEVYKTEYDNILTDFYIPALSNAITYDRAVGFFSIASLFQAAQGIAGIVRNNGKIRFIVGSVISHDDYSAIVEGYEKRINSIEEQISEQIIEIFQDQDHPLFSNRMNAVSWLIANNYLEIKVALRKIGMYHEKVGIICDVEGNKLVFNGSANETPYALIDGYNYESINVFKSWISGLENHYLPHIEGFEKLWKNEAKDTIVIGIPETAKKHINIIASKGEKPDLKIELEAFEQFERAKIAENQHKEIKPKIPLFIGNNKYELRKHQLQAQKAWKNSGGKGILQLATGAGKTITAIHIACKVSEVGKLILVVAVPYVNLAEQWIETLEMFNIFPIKCYDNSSLWEEVLSKNIYRFQTNAIDFFAIVVVNKTFRGDKFQNAIKKIEPEKCLVIGDECHHHGSSSFKNKLPDVRFRIGLSATPFHYIKEDNNVHLTDYYGDVVYEYDLKDAIKDDILTQYNYYPVLVELTNEESEKYLELSAKIGMLIMTKDMNEENPDLDKLFRERSRLISNCSNKLIVLKGLLKEISPQNHTLFYSGEGSVEDEPEVHRRQINKLNQLLRENGWSVRPFTSKEGRNERRDILEEFSLGIINALSAIKCLDEGIDVPACKTAFILSSSRNYRQFVQRRGRILRKAPGKDKAEIYDFIVHVSNDFDMDKYSQNLFKKELERVLEFSYLAMNESYTFNVLKPLLEKYDMLHLI